MKARDLIEKTLAENRTNLTEWEASRILSEYGIPVVEGRIIGNIEEGLVAAEDMGYPLALKVLSPNILHKSDRGGVVLNIGDGEAFKKAWREIEGNVQGVLPSVQGMLMQKMAPAGVEAIIGVHHDPSFGPVLLFGLGGLFVEVFQDVSLRLIPIQRVDAEEMVEEVQGYPLLTGFRGREPVDRDFLLDTLLNVSRMVEDLPHIKEMDMNPFFLYPLKGMAVDALITLHTGDGEIEGE